MSDFLDINAYTYTLPPERIAAFPLEKRDDSKLLVYRQGNIAHRVFRDISTLLPDDAILYFNDTRVIQARLIFRKESGASIEVFLLHPVRPSPLLIEAMQTTSSCTWICTIGNLKRWNVGTKLTDANGSGTLTAELLDRGSGLVTFSWDTGESFAEIIERTGQMPLPPYLKRNAVELDRERYQTVYSRHEGAVAAPTAGLHFTEEVLESLRGRNVPLHHLTLHVSAGTFQPVKERNALLHKMHGEQIVIEPQVIRDLLTENGTVIPVGTTSMRTLESIYWYGVRLIVNPDSKFEIGQNDPYTLPQDITPAQALSAVLERFDDDEDSLVGETSIFIRPGYKFRICKGLITNFHQPSSTLILLVAAFVGDDWQRIYQDALDGGYRFLSYGDSSLLLPD